MLRSCAVRRPLHASPSPPLPALLAAPLASPRLPARPPAPSKPSKRPKQMKVTVSLRLRLNTVDVPKDARRYLRRTVSVVEERQERQVYRRGRLS